MNPPRENLVRVMKKVMGKDISRYEASFLAQTLRKRLSVTGVDTVADYAAFLPDHPGEAEELWRALNITYSEFFRNPLTFALLEQWILPRLLAERERQGRAEIRIWSAGCAAGPEAYSLAILLADLSAARDPAPPFRIIATDLSEAALAAAREGVYEAAALQNVRLKHLRAYFSPQGTAYRVGAGLRDRVDFSSHDLLDERFASPPESIYGDFDLVMCGNLLFYYRRDLRRFILNRVHRALAGHGYLATGEVERGIVEQDGEFQAVAPPGAIFEKRIF